VWNEWYKDPKHRSMHRERVEKYGNTSISYSKTMVRELNQNMIVFRTIKSETVNKYDIKKNDKEEYYTNH